MLEHARFSHIVATCPHPVAAPGGGVGAVVPPGSEARPGALHLRDDLASGRLAGPR